MIAMLRMKSRRLLRRVVVCVGLMGVLAVGLLWSAAGRLAAPSPSRVGAPPTWLGEVAAISIPGAASANLRGWYVEHEAPRGCVILAHASRKDRRAMLGRARFLHDAGYGVMLYDARAHGESDGGATFGYLEAHDARAAVTEIRRRCSAAIGYIGVSLGGAAAVLGAAPIGVSAVVLEAVYGRLQDAIANRIELYVGSLGRPLTPLLLWQVEPRLGFDPYQLNPLDRIAEIGAPLLLIAGTADQRTRRRESRLLFDRARPPKELWLIDDAAHVDFHRYAGEEYERRILEFLGQYLGGAFGDQHSAFSS